VRLPGGLGKRRLWVLAVAATLLGLGVPLLLRARASDDPGGVAAEKVTRGVFRREVTALGTLQAARATPITCPAEVGRPQKIAVLAADGTSVRAGEVVVEFDTTEAQAELSDGSADRTTADNKIVQSRAKGEEAEQHLELDLDLARAKLDRAEDVAPTDEGIFSRHEVIESAVDRELLARQKEIDQANLDATRRLDQAQIALGQIERSKADIRIRQATMSLSALEVRAPHDGIFMLERRGQGSTLAVGQQVWPGQKIGEIPDLTVLEARVQVLEADAAGLKPGCKARVTIDGKPGHTYPGTVRRVGSVSEPVYRQSPVKYFETVIALDHTDPAVMRPGQRVHARLVLEEQKNVLSIPRGALFEREGQRIVYRLAGGRFLPTPVTIGRASVARIVVTDGVQEGDRIALRDPTRAVRDILDERGVQQAGEEQEGP